MADANEAREALAELVVEQIRLAKGIGQISSDAATAIHTLVEALYTLEPATVEE